MREKERVRERAQLMASPTQSSRDGVSNWALQADSTRPGAANKCRVSRIAARRTGRKHLAAAGKAAAHPERTTSELVGAGKMQGPLRRMRRRAFRNPPHLPFLFLLSDNLEKSFPVTAIQKVGRVHLFLFYTAKQVCASTFARAHAISQMTRRKNNNKKTC